MVWRQRARLSMSCKNIWLLLLCKSGVVLRYLNSPAGSFSEEILVFPTSSRISTQKIAMEIFATKGVSVAQGPVNSRITDRVSTRRKDTYATSESQYATPKYMQQIPLCFRGSYSKGRKTLMTHDRLKTETMTRPVLIFVLKHKMHCNDRNTLFSPKFTSFTDIFINKHIYFYKQLSLPPSYLASYYSFNSLNAIKPTHFYEARFNTNESPHAYLPMLPNSFNLPGIYFKQELWILKI